MKDEQLTFRASELVARLQKLIAEHGDLPVLLHDPDTSWSMEIGVLHKAALKYYAITGDYAARPDGHCERQPDPMTPTREQWLERCTAVLRAKGGLEPAVALNVACSQLENCNDDLTESPEDAAEDEMSYWTED